MIRWLTFAVIATGLAWSGIWLWQASAQRSATESWIAGQQARGWLVEVDDITLRGFPNRLDQTFTGLTIGDPDANSLLETEVFQILRLSYAKDHIIAVWPTPLRITGPQGTLTAQSDQMRASVISAPDGTLNRANLEAAVLNITTNAGTLAIAALNAALQQTGETTYRITLNADGVVPGDLIRTSSSLPQTLQTLRADLHLTFIAPLDTQTPQRPLPTRIDLALAEADWGPMRLKLAADLDVSDTGLLDGSVTVQADNWRDMLALARDSVPNGTLRLIDNGLTAIAGLSGNAQSLDITLTIRRGQMSLGLLPLGPAPRLR